MKVCIHGSMTVKRKNAVIASHLFGFRMKEKICPKHSRLN